MPDKRDESFSGKYRLHKSDDFRKVFSRGTRTATPYFVIYSLPNQLPFPRLGIQVKAKLGSAARRNYLKRIVREVFRKKKYDFRDSLDLVFIAEKPMLELDYQEFVRLFEQALKNHLK